MTNDHHPACNRKMVVIFLARSYVNKLWIAKQTSRRRKIVKNEMNDMVVVDDNLLLLSVISRIFKNHGYTVRLASDGLSALSAIRDRIPDILISDLNMPRMSGFQLLSIVRRRFPKVAVIAMSSAYSGVIVPAGVAADGFYGKGLGNITRMFDTLSVIENETVRHAARSIAPTWAPAMPGNQSSILTMPIDCSECFRTFSHSLHNSDFFCEERRCPFCFHNIRLSFIRPEVKFNKAIPPVRPRGRLLSEAVGIQ